MTLELPVRSDLDAYSFTLELEAKNYSFYFRFNERMGRWIMTIGDTDGNPIVAGVPVLTGLNLLGQYQSAKLPPGQFLAYDQSGKGKNAGRYDLGSDVLLLYQEAGTT